MADEPPPKRRNRWDEPAGAAKGSNGVAGEHALQSSTSLNPSISDSLLAAQEITKDALAKAQLAAEVQRTLQQQMSSMSGLPPGAINLQTAVAPKPPTVTLDSQGRLLDERGKVIQSTAKPQATVKVNQTSRSNPLLEEAPPPDVTSNKYFDPRMSVPGQSREQRKKRAFNFVAEGHFSKRADEMRAKAAVEQLLREARAKQPVKKDTVIKGGLKDSSSDARAAQPPIAVSAATLQQKLAEVPNVEWWDKPLLRGGSYQGATGESFDASLVTEALTHYVEHPVPIEPPAEPVAPPPQPLPLTKRERKKLRTQRRLAAEKEKQDQIRCGLMAPPPPKVKISNLMQAMKNEAVLDPSAIEAKVRAEMAQRVKNHEMRNQARKLTPQQRREKKRRKMLNDPTGGGTPVTLYRIDQMPNRQKLYKIDINAQQNHLTGVALLTDSCNLVLVEGGPKAQRRYQKLLMHRIDWSDMPADDDDDDDDQDDAEERRRNSANVCRVVWEGFVVKPHFKNFRVEAAHTPDAARKLLKDKGCEHYWDMAARFDSEARVIQEEEEEEEDDDDDEDEDQDDEDELDGHDGAGLAEEDGHEDDAVQYGEEDSELIGEGAGGEAMDVDDASAGE